MSEATQSTDELATKVETIKDMVLAQVDDDTGTLPDEARFSITVTYKNRKGNISLKNGEVWGAFESDYKAELKFSDNVDDPENEDPYFLKIRSYGITVVSVSERGNKTELGELSNIVIES